MSFAPASAAASSATSFSASTYLAASAMISPDSSCAKMVCASGSKPFSFAIVARVLLFGRYGLYKSSTATCVCASRIAFLSSSVSLPCSSMLASTVCFLSSRLRKYVSLSKRFLSTSSFNEPVASFLYLAIKGMVFPSSISLTAASTCPFLICSSSAIAAIISIFLPL